MQADGGANQQTDVNTIKMKHLSKRGYKHDQNKHITVNTEWAYKRYQFLTAKYPHAIT